MTQSEILLTLADWKAYYGDLSWNEYYTRFLCPSYSKTDGQRNYQRNEDVVYHTTNTKTNKRTINYLLGDIEAPVFELHSNGNLYYSHSSYGSIQYNKNNIEQVLYPFAYMSIEADKDNCLIANIPTVAYGDVDIQFNSDGELIIKTNIDNGTN